MVRSEGDFPHVEGANRNNQERPEESVADESSLVLVVDDEEFLRLTVLDFFEDHGYRVVEAANGREGLAVFEEKKPDVVVTDLRMPEMGGLELLAAVRERSPDTPVVIVSGIGVLQDAIEALRLGAWDYVTKPVSDMYVLKHAVENSLERARLIRENREYREHLERLVEERTEDLRAAKNSITEQLAFLETLINTIPSPIYFRDLDGVCQLCNTALEDFLGLPRDRIIGRGMSDMMGEEYADFMGGTDAKVLETGLPIEMEIASRRPCDNSRRHMLFTKAPFRDTDGEIVGMVTVMSDTTERREAEAKLQHQAFHDDLTGLPNRALFMDRLGESLKHLKRDSEHRFAVLYLDLDRFKVINDSLGHDAGDEMLVEISSRLARCIRDIDTLARFGGDEFAILLDEISGVRDALQVVERIIAEFKPPFFINGQELFLSSSIGVVPGAAQYESPVDIIRDADIAMYRSKTTGRGGYQLFDKEMHHRMVSTMELETEMRRALEEESGFHLLFQPIVSLKSGRVEGFEALARWDHPVRGLVSPGQFIPVAEDSGMIVTLGAWALREACTRMRRWIQSCDRCPLLTMSVNISARQLMDPGFMDIVKQTLADTGLDGRNLRMELTESVLIESDDHVRSLLEQLRDLGITLALDDFGTGYSSLSYLRKFPIDVVKIDRTFIIEIERFQNKRDIVPAIVSMAHTLGMGVVAEGVETVAQLSRLREYGCESIQGYLVAKPLPDREIDALISEKRLGSLLPEECSRTASSSS